MEMQVFALYADIFLIAGPATAYHWLVIAELP